MERYHAQTMYTASSGSFLKWGCSAPIRGKSAFLGAPFLRRASCTKKALRPDSGAMPKRSPMLPVSPVTPPNSNTQERWRRLQTFWGFHHAATVPSVIKESQHPDLTEDIPCVGANPLRPLTQRVRPIIVQRGPTDSLGMTLSRAKDSGARSGHCNGAVDDERPVGVPGPMGQWLHPNEWSLAAGPTVCLDFRYPLLGPPRPKRADRLQKGLELSGPANVEGPQPIISV